MKPMFKMIYNATVKTKVIDSYDWWECIGENSLKYLTIYCVMPNVLDFISKYGVKNENEPQL